MKRSHRTVLSLCLSLLLCVTCSSLFSVKASAAEVSPDAQNEWFLLPFNYFDDYSAIGTFDSTSGTYNLRGGSQSDDYLNFSVDVNSSGVFPTFQPQHTYLIYLTVSIESSSPVTFRASTIQHVWGNPSLGLPVRPVIYSSNSYVNSTSTFTVISQVTPSVEHPISTSSRLVIGLNESVHTSGRVSWGFYALDITENSESEVNQIIAAIQDQTGQIKDKIDEVLTPEGENNLGEAVDQITDQVQENFGALGFAHDTVENFIGLFNEQPPAPVINVPPLKMKIKGVEHQFFNGYQYDFRSMEQSGLSVLVGAVRTAGTLVLWWAFLQYCLKEFDRFFRR